MELKIHKIKADAGEFYIRNKILVGMQSPCDTSCPKALRSREFSQLQEAGAVPGNHVTWRSGERGRNLCQGGSCSSQGIAMGNPGLGSLGMKPELSYPNSR